MSLLPKIQALLSRAAHPETPVEEARTSAVIAAKLIVEHQVVLTEKNGAPGRGSGRMPGPWDGDPFSYIDFIVNEILKRNQTSSGRPWYGRGAAPPPPPPPAPKKRSRAKGPKTRQKKPPQGVPDPGRCPHGLIKIFCAQCHGTPPTRRVYSAVAPSSARDLACTCCRQPIRPGQRMCWVGEDQIFPNLTPLTHEACVQHWQRDWCVLCGKKTT